MRVSRTPLRITLGGGGSDLRKGGMCITAAITVYVYVCYNRNHSDHITLKYQDRVEILSAYSDISHDLIKKLAPDDTGYELTSLSDVYSGTGLGSSAAFTVGTIKALHPELSAAAIATEAMEVEGVGWQDQWATALGGINIITETNTYPLDVDLSGLRLYDTGIRHDAKLTLAFNRRPHQATLLNQANKAIDGLKSGDFSFLTHQWEAKYAAARTREHAYINNMIRDLGVPAKLVGAGNGGMILAYSPKPLDTPLREIPFEVDTIGTTLL